MVCERDRRTRTLRSPLFERASVAKGLLPWGGTLSSCSSVRPPSRPIEDLARCQSIEQFRQAQRWLGGVPMPVPVGVGLGRFRRRPLDVAGRSARTGRDTGSPGPCVWRPCRTDRGATSGREPYRCLRPGKAWVTNHLERGGPMSRRRTYREAFYRRNMSDLDIGTGGK